MKTYSIMLFEFHVINFFQLTWPAVFCKRRSNMLKLGHDLIVKKEKRYGKSGV